MSLNVDASLVQTVVLWCNCVTAVHLWYQCCVTGVSVPAVHFGPCVVPLWCHCGHFDAAVAVLCATVMLLSVSLVTVCPLWCALRCYHGGTLLYNCGIGGATVGGHGWSLWNECCGTGVTFTAVHFGYVDMVVPL